MSIRCMMLDHRYPRETQEKEGTSCREEEDLIRESRAQLCWWKGENSLVNIYQNDGLDFTYNNYYVYFEFSLVY